MKKQRQTKSKRIQKIKKLIKDKQQALANRRKNPDHQYLQLNQIDDQVDDQTGISCQIKKMSNQITKNEKVQKEIKEELKNISKVLGQIKYWMKLSWRNNESKI